MADRQILTKTVAKGSYPALQPAVNTLDIVFAAEGADKSRFVASGNDLVLAHNSDPTNPYTVTISSVADDKGRSGDITAYALQAGEIAVFGPFQKAGWARSDGYVHLEASNAAVKFAVIQL